jgi:hypothetical protein
MGAVVVQARVAGVKPMGKVVCGVAESRGAAHFPEKEYG